MRTAASPQGAQIAVSVAFGRHPALPFIPDTGSSATAVNQSFATPLRLRRVNEDDTQDTQCSVTVTPRVASGPWFIGSPTKGGQLAHREALPAVALDALYLGPELGGLLGSDEMAHFGSVVFDYAGGRLLLGVG